MSWHSVWRILLKNIFPYLISVVILRLALSIPQTIALESTLSYLGLGLDVNTPSLGILLRNARNYFLQYPYLLVFPAVIVSLITITFYLVGNAFSDAADQEIMYRTEEMFMANMEKENRSYLPET